MSTHSPTTSGQGLLEGSAKETYHGYVPPHLRRETREINNGYVPPHLRQGTKGPVNPKSRRLVFSEVEEPKHGPGGASYATVANSAYFNAPGGPINYLQQKKSRQIVEQHAEQEYPPLSDQPMDQTQVVYKEYAGGNRERGHNERSGLTGGSVFSTLSSAPGLGGRSPVLHFDSKLEWDNYRLKEERKSLQDEYRKIEQLLEKYNVENHHLRDKVRDLEHGNINGSKIDHDSKLIFQTEKVKMLEALLPESIITLLSQLDVFKTAVLAASTFLADNIVFRASEEFPHELEAAGQEIRPFLGASLVKTLSAYAEKASATGDDFLGSRSLVRITSQAFLYAYYFGRAQEPTKHDILTMYAKIFKISSWALPGATNRSTFDKMLGNVVLAGRQVRSSKKDIGPGMNLSITCPFPTNNTCDHVALEAVDPEGRPIAFTGDTHGEVLAILTCGLKNGNKVALRPQALLKSTVENALRQEEAEFHATEPMSTERSEGDGRD
ncbi:hypothetical protein CPB83DRAFT_910425 [Crepidotus variabilis]|uniref:Uncharacterized protein n=1 Tax=Crepidotus variabilis TaxID=179855 RepID=A0A9P6E738_9AGAR|nr:hypothetical protein CPB83DRAFT_910425 [Crepidotus variabilis]